MGRKQKPYQTSWNEIIPGLAKDYDNRWRIIETGKRFSQSDERLAIQKFREWESSNSKRKMSLQIPLSPVTPAAEGATGWDIVGDSTDDSIKPQAYHSQEGQPTTGTYLIDEVAIFSAVRNLIINDPILAAKRLGIPEIAHLQHIQIPQDIKLSDLLANYISRAPNKQSTLEIKSVFEKFLEITGFKTLADINLNGLQKYREAIEQSKYGAATKKCYYGRVKTVVSKNLKYGVDAVQIRQALDKFKVLFTDQPMPQVNPQPISRLDFHKLLNTADIKWQAILLLSLNCCLHLGEALKLKWSELNLETKTYACIRSKTSKHRIPRAATLWQITVDTLKQVKKTKSEYIFTTKHGVLHNRSAAGVTFSKIRAKAGVPDTVKFDSIRDGSFTAACRAIDGLNLARLLAGHSNGMSDHYVLRNPESVAPACAAVYKHYFG